MLSILIPTFNYNTYPLVLELKRQCDAISNFSYEIIINDDASTNDHENTLLNKLPNCYYFKQVKNQGLSASRNFLIEKASFNWCLFLDDDVWPKTNNYIETYKNCIQKSTKQSLFFGGLKYTEVKPNANELLRWLYGNAHEALSFEKRLTNKPKHFLCSNILVEKTLLIQYKFPTEIKTYGYEDLIFNLNLIKDHVPIFQIDNPVFHEKLDTSEIYLKKTQKALDNLSLSLNQGLLNDNDTKISKIRAKFKNKIFSKLVVISFKINKKWMERVLSSRLTNLNLFNLYRLGYFYSIHEPK